MNYKGQLEGFPQEVVEKMLDYQEEQGNKRDVTVFEERCSVSTPEGGGHWAQTPEEHSFWYDVISDKNFAKFFKKYPKTEQSVPSKTEEQEQEAIPEPTQEDNAMNELAEKTKAKERAELDLTEILKDVPKGTKLYSPIFGEVLFDKILLSNEDYPIYVKATHTYEYVFTKNGYYHIEFSNLECLLFPSKDNRDWSTFKADYSIDTPVMCSDDGISWKLRYYAGDNRVFLNGYSYENVTTISFKQIIPVTDFDFINRCRKKS